MAQLGDTPHVPEAAPIDAYGNGGFRFSGMSHIGSLICVPRGIYAWYVKTAIEITAESLQPLMAHAKDIDVVLIGTGGSQIFLNAEVRAVFGEAGLIMETMTTGAAARTYNVLLAEQRAVAAALIAVD